MKLIIIFMLLILVSSTQAQNIWERTMVERDGWYVDYEQVDSNFIYVVLSQGSGNWLYKSYDKGTTWIN